MKTPNTHTETNSSAQVGAWIKWEQRDVEICRCYCIANVDVRSSEAMSLRVRKQVGEELLHELITIPEDEEGTQTALVALKLLLESQITVAQFRAAQYSEYTQGREYNTARAKWIARQVIRLQRVQNCTFREV